MYKIISITLILFASLLFGGKVYSETVGLQKTITLADNTSGNFLTVGQIVYQPECYQDTSGVWRDVWKVEIILYKNKTAYDSGAEKMNYRYEVQIDSQGFVFNLDSVYDLCLTLPYFDGATKVEE